METLTKMSAYKTAEDYLKQINPHIVAAAVKRLSELSELVGRTGGILAVMVIHHGGSVTSLASTSVGNPGPKILRYAFNAHEKPKRLFECYNDPEHAHVAASQSADGENTFGGAIVFTNDGALVIISFSGAPPNVDEAVVYVLGEKLGLSCPRYENRLLDDARRFLENAVTPEVRYEPKIGSNAIAKDSPNPPPEVGQDV